ncbi:MAG: site-specific DNA-methyltransferase [Thauera sp.]|nr:MAG: site-specific DNA-methyltransferase [Thauera sp.]
MSDDKKIDSLKHRRDTRRRIPSREEAGMEDAAPDAKRGKADYPLNPVVHRGQDPELFWLGKYGDDDRDEVLSTDIRSLYRVEHIGPEKLIQRLYRLKVEESAQSGLFAPSVDELFNNYTDVDELDKPTYYYKQADKWSNRLIQGDSLLVMASLLEREGMRGAVQTIYIDPPYGIKYNSNWQIRLNDRNVKDGDDASLSAEPEQIKAFRDTWELGIHSYLSYLRDRLLIARELLADSGSCFVQISDENVHLVRCLMDEVFGSENFVSLITFKKTGGQTSNLLAPVSDYIVWYARDVERVKCKYHQLYREMKQGEGHSTGERYDQALLPDGSVTGVNSLESIPLGTRFFQYVSLTSNRPAKEHEKIPFNFQGKDYLPAANRTWSTTREGFDRLVAAGRIYATSGSLRYVRYFDDFPATPIGNLWDDVSGSGDKLYVVQTTQRVIERCILMTSDPGDLILDPTCGSGTTAHVAEQWGRRWITIDTSRVALNIAKTRLMTATYPWYTLADEKNGVARADWDVRHGFDYKTVQRVTLGSLANDEPPETVTLFDQPALDRKKLRVAGPFTVETLQAYEPLSPDAVEDASLDHEQLEVFQARIFEHLKSAGVKNGARNENAVFVRIDALADSDLHAEGYYEGACGEQKAYLHIGPQFAPVSKAAVNAAVKACRARGDAQWLLVLGFAFESDVENSTQNQRAGSFEVTKVRMHDDLLQAGLTRKDRKAASFVTIGEPDIAIERDGDHAIVEIRGLDIYDPVRDEVRPRSVADIAYWMLDDDYDGASFMVRQVFFCGGDRDEFDKWKKGLSDLAKSGTKKKVERTLKIELDDDAFDRLYGHRSHPLLWRKGKRVAVRVVSQFGEESTKVLVL